MKATFQRLLPLLLFAFLLAQASTWHDFHFSKCEIEYQAKQQSLQISMQLFIDDLEVALKAQGHEALFLCSEKEAEEAETYLLDYLKANFQLKVNEQPTVYTYIGRDVSDDFAHVWCYFEVNDLEKLDNIQVKNSILTEIYEDQKNVVRIKGPDGKKGYLMLNQQNVMQELHF
ncbi:MAG: DUF6702 family protein [Bacteroidota bacterium]